MKKLIIIGLVLVVIGLQGMHSKEKKKIKNVDELRQEVIHQRNECNKNINSMQQEITKRSGPSIIIMDTGENKLNNK